MKTVRGDKKREFQRPERQARAMGNEGNNPPELALCYPDGSMTRWEDRNVECDRSAGADHYGGKPVSQVVKKL
jgi:hypothetical protein